METIMSEVQTKREPEFSIVDKTAHRLLRMNRSTPTFPWAARAISLVLANAELPEACQAYPCVFTKSEDGLWSLVAVTGVEVGRNLFLDDQSRWTGRYLPIVLRTWPFRLVQQPDAEGSRLIAAHLPALTSGSGEALFDQQGNESPWLLQVMKELVVLDQSTQIVHTHVKALEDAGLLQSRNLQFMLPDGRQLDLGGFHVVDEQLLEALPNDKAGALHAQGVLAMAYLHLLSMRQFRHLLERAALATSTAPSLTETL